MKLHFSRNVLSDNEAETSWVTVESEDEAIESEDETMVLESCVLLGGGSRVQPRAIMCLHMKLFKYKCICPIQILLV